MLYFKKNPQNRQPSDLLCKVTEYSVESLPPQSSQPFPSILCLFFEFPPSPATQIKKESRQE